MALPTWLTTLGNASWVVILSVLVLYFVLGSIRLLFHPLRGYPGPWLGSLSDAYAGYFAIRKNSHIVTYLNFQKYGPVIRQAPNRLVFNTVTALNDIYLNPIAIKGDAYKKTITRIKYPNMVNVTEKTHHRRKRKLIGPVLMDRSMRVFEPIMASEIDTFLRSILDSSRHDIAVNMSDLCKRLAVDIIGHLAFGYPFETQTRERYQFLPSLIDTLSWRLNIYMTFPPLASLETLFLLFGIRKAYKLGDLIKRMVQMRASKAKDAHHDLYSYVADHIGTGENDLRDGELWPEAILFILAGGTTTAATLSATFFYLSGNSDAYKKLAKEIRTTFQTAQEICWGPKLSSCKYLRACIDETLRISPPALGNSWRQQDTSAHGNEPFVVDGHVIPPGTQVVVNLYSLFHNEEYFPDSFAYKPERWLEPIENRPGEKKEPADTTHKAFVPFLIGDRSCAGKAMAYMELSLTVARCFWFFDFKSAPGKAGELGAGIPGDTSGRHRAGEFQMGDIFVASHDGPNLVFKSRGSFWKEL